MKKKLLVLLLMLVIPLSAYAATTTHYNIAVPTVGGSQNTWGSILNAALGSFDTFVWSASSGTTIGVNAPAAGSANVTLANPINNVQSLSFTTTGKHVALPPMNATSSPVSGGTLVFSNAGSNAYAITAADGTTSVLASLGAGQSVQLQALSNSTTNGAWQVDGPYLISVSGSVNLGTSVTATNPSNVAAANTGLYATTSSNVGVSVLGTSVGIFTSTGLNGSAVGATTSSTGSFTTLATPSATITGGTINGASLGATTSSTAKVTTFSATAATLGGVAYPTTNGTNTQFLQTNGSGTATWASPVSVMIGGCLGNTIPQSATSFVWMGASSGEANVYTNLPIGTLKNLLVKAGAGLPSGQTAVITLRQNATNTAVTCTITGPSDGCSDTTHTATSTGGVFDLQVVTSATTGALAFNFSVEIAIP